LPEKRAGCTNVRTIRCFVAQNRRAVGMTMRSRRETVHFRHPFRLKGIDRQLAPGDYEVITDEEMIEGLSFPCFRRVATMIMVPGAPPQRSAMEMISISSVDLSDAQRTDASAPW
jgi:hypothetical protein